MMRCNNCMTLFDDDEELVQCKVDENDEPIDNACEGEVIKGCYKCRTDQYLMDME